MRHMERVGALALACLVAGTPPAHGAIEQRASGRIQIGVVHDTNVLEELGDETADQHLSLFGSVSHRLAFSERVRLDSSAQLGLLRYRDVENDSRVLGQGRWELSYETRSGAAFGGSLLLDGRDYADSASTRGYGLFRSEIFVRGPLGPFAAEVTGGRTLLDYKITPGQEQRGNRIDGALRRRIFRHIVVGAGAGTGSFRFNRRAVRVAGGAPLLEPFNQRDEFVRVGVDAQYLRGVFLNVAYMYLDNDSNAFGNTYTYHRVDVTTRYRLTDLDVSLGLSVRLESRDYADDLSRFNVINFDSEREENNHVIGELSRPLREDLSVKVRGGWHRNESVFRDRFYERVQMETHLEWQF